MRASRSGEKSRAPNARRLRRLFENRRRLVSSASLRRMRTRRLLRFFKKQTRDETFSRHKAPDCQIVRAERRLGLVLRRRAFFRAVSRSHGLKIPVRLSKYKQSNLCPISISRKKFRRLFRASTPPVQCRLAVSVVAPRHSRFQVGRKRNRRSVHSERHEDSHLH